MNIGTVIGTVKASDNIEVISYLITAGNPGYAFSISTNGQLKTIMSLDYDTISNYSLTVEVRDAAGNTSNASITVKITDVDAAPTVATLNASGVQNNSAVLNGNVSHLGTNSDGSEQVNEYGFVYSTNISQSNDLHLGKSGVERVGRVNINELGAYSYAIAGLSPGTAHYFRAFAVNDGGTNYGNISNFSTTYHQTFTLNSTTNEMQSNLIHPLSIHTYNIPLSNTYSFNLTVDAVSNVLDSLAIYEGTNTNNLYIRPGPFSIVTRGNPIAMNNITKVTTTFEGVDSGRRYLVLPLVTTSHRLVISNNNMESESYTLTLGEETGTTNHLIGRLLIDETPTEFLTNNQPELYWFHMPPNRSFLDVAWIGLLSSNTTTCGVYLDNDSAFPPSLNSYTRLLGSYNGYNIVRILNNDTDTFKCRFKFRVR